MKSTSKVIFTGFTVHTGFIVHTGFTQVSQSEVISTADGEAKRGCDPGVSPAQMQMPVCTYAVAWLHCLGADSDESEHRWGDHDFDPGKAWQRELKSEAFFERIGKRLSDTNGEGVSVLDVH